MATTNLIWRGDAVLARVLGAAREGVQDTVQATAETARANAPRLSGSLASSIDSDSGGMSGTVEATEEHAIFQEFGTSRHPAQPFLRPAADQEFPELADRIRRNGGL